MKRILSLLLLLIAYCSLFIAPVRAAGEFSTSISAKYEVGEDGETIISQTITLINLFSTIHAVSYSLVISGTGPGDIKATENSKDLPVNVVSGDNQTSATVTFPNAVVGKGKSRIFTIEYKDTKVATKNGQVWEITIPKIENPGQYEKYEVTLFVPRDFGEPAYISPKPETKKTETEFNSFYFTKEQLKTSGVVTAFGEFQIFGFELAYHLKNPLKTLGETEIALPPDTAFQRMFYTQIQPRPLKIRLDEDGNWLAKYRLKAGETLDVKVAGSVQLFATPQQFFPPQPQDLSHYLTPQKYWQSDSPEILELAKRLKNPAEIYNFATDTLSYDYSRVKEGVERLGAAAALANKNKAICMEFTDLFIALSRAAGIPAREINGYAYTENPKIQPLSLVADVLHAWPEYWDSERGVWIPVDPTWGNTTGGVDFFSKLDLAHFAFVIHGKNPDEPYPAGSYKLAENPQKDIIVFFATLPPPKKNLILSLKINRQLLPFLPLQGSLLIENIGAVALYDISPQVFAQNGKISKLEKIAFLPPFTTQDLSFTWRPDSFFATSDEITALVEDEKTSYTMGAEVFFWRILGIFIILTILTGGVISLIFLRKTKYEIRSFKIPKFPWRLPFQK